MHDEHDHEHPHDHEHEGEGMEEFEAAFEARSQLFLELRQQNLELLRIAAQVAGLGGTQGPMKPNDLRQALKSLWEVYGEFYAWIDPEETEDGEEDEDEE